MKDTKDYQDALVIAERVHAKQLRADGTAYINHPIRVADILIELGRPAEEVIAGLLHDTVEDTEDEDEKIRLIAEIEQRFGFTVMAIIRHAMKISKKTDGNRATRVRIDLHHYKTGTFKNHNVKMADVVANLEEAHSLPEDFRVKWVKEKELFVSAIEQMYSSYDGSEFQISLLSRARRKINELLV